MDTAEHAALRVVLNHETDNKIKQLQEELARERAARGRTLACVLAQFNELFDKYPPEGLHIRNIGGDMLALANKLRGEGQYREAHLVEEHAHELCEKVGIYALREEDWVYGRIRPDPGPPDPSFQLVDESDYESEPESAHGEGAERGHGPGTAEEREGEPRGA